MHSTNRGGGLRGCRDRVPLNGRKRPQAVRSCRWSRGKHISSERGGARHAPVDAPRERRRGGRREGGEAVRLNGWRRRDGRTDQGGLPISHKWLGGSSELPRPPPPSLAWQPHDPNGRRPGCDKKTGMGGSWPGHPPPHWLSSTWPGATAHGGVEPVRHPPGAAGAATAIRLARGLFGPAVWPCAATGFPRARPPHTASAKIACQTAWLAFLPPTLRCTVLVYSTAPELAEEAWLPRARRWPRGGRASLADCTALPLWEEPRWTGPRRQTLRIASASRAVKYSLSPNESNQLALEDEKHVYSSSDSFLKNPCRRGHVPLSIGGPRSRGDGRGGVLLRHVLRHG